MATALRQPEALSRPGLRAGLRAARVTGLSLSRRSLAVAVVLLAAADYGCRLADGSVVLLAPLDGFAHLLTMLFVLWAFGCRLDRPFAKAALFISVAIDLDHIPQYLGWYGLTQGTPRPYTHSLLTIVVLLACAALLARGSADTGGARLPVGSQIGLGLAVGAAVHFCRDMAEPHSGVSLLWPVSYHSFSYAHSSYMVAMALLAAICLARLARQRPVSLPAGAPVEALQSARRARSADRRVSPPATAAPRARPS